MRRYTTKRGFSTSYKILLGFEKEFLNRIHPIQPVTVKGKVHNEWNPYIKMWLRERYKIYNDSLNKKHTQVEYIEAIRQWYQFHQFVDKRGQVSVGKAIGHYEDTKPDADWKTTPQKASKSHHSTNEYKSAHAKEMKKRWRQSERGRESTRLARERAKERRFVR